MSIEPLKTLNYGGSNLLIAEKINEIIKIFSLLDSRISKLEYKLDKGAETPYGNIRRGGMYD